MIMIMLENDPPTGIVMLKWPKTHYCRTVTGDLDVFGTKAMTERRREHYRTNGNTWNTRSELKLSPAHGSLCNLWIWSEINSQTSVSLHQLPTCSDLQSEVRPQLTGRHSEHTLVHSRPLWKLIMVPWFVSNSCCRLTVCTFGLTFSKYINSHQMSFKDEGK